MKELAYDKIKEYVNKDDIVIDCYRCSSIGFYIKDMKKVIMVEIQKRMLNMLRKLKKNLIFEMLKLFMEMFFRKDKIKDANTIIPDPPKVD